jgi:exonuclease SbcC
MIPLKLYLENFLSYSEDVPPDRRTLDFRGFNLACLSGKNGHGKSALLDAITWALWGECRGRNKEEVIKRGAKKARVELEFDLDGNHYWIRRTIARRKGFATSTSVDFQVFDTITESFKPIAQGGKTQDAIEKMLKMDYNAFICSSFILQGRADEFTKKPPVERKEILARILELGKYEELGKKSKEFVQKSKLESESLEIEINHIESEVSQKDTLKIKLEETRAEEEKITLELREAEKLYEGTIIESEALRAKIETHKRLIQYKNEIEDKCARLKKEQEKSVEEIEKDKEIISKEKEIFQGYGEFEKIREEERKLSEKLRSYTNLIQELDKINNLINDEKFKIENSISSLIGRKEEAKNRLNHAMKLINREQEIRAGFMDFLSTESLEKKLEKKRETLEKLRSRERELENSIQRIRFQIEARIKELEAKINELAEKAEKAKGLEEECEKLMAKIRSGEEVQTRGENLKARLKEIGEERNASISRKLEFNKRQKEEIDKLNLIKSQSDKPQCPLCESPLEEEAREALLQKLERLLLDLDSKVEEESKSIKQLEKEEKEITVEIKTAELEVKNLPELNKQLGEKEKSLEDSISASKDLESTKEEQYKLRNIIEKENFSAEFRGELKEAVQEIKKLDYDEKQHKEIKNKLERLRGFQTDHKRLEDAKASKDETENRLASIEAEVASLTNTLREELFATQHKERALEIENQIREVGYDEQQDKKLKATLRDLERFFKEKENLDRARLSLSHRQKERESLEERLKTERERLERTDKEIKELEEVVTQGKTIQKKKELVESEVSRLGKAKDERLEEKTSITNDLERIARLENRKEEILKQLKKLRYVLTIYQELDKAFGKNGIQARIIDGALEEIEIEANKILRRLTDGNMTLELDTLRLTQKGAEKETLEIKIGDSTGTRSYETYSGGEAFRIDFALRIAISRFIANCSGAQLRTLVIDEGFGTQDKDGLSQFVQVINAIKNDFDKILVITHIDELKDRFPVRIEVTKESGKGSSFEVIYS